MQRINNRIVLPLLTVALGIIWIVIGLGRYGWYADGKPGSGFFPTIAGALLLAVSILAVLTESRLETPDFRKFHIYPVITVISIVLVAMLIGFFPALTIYVFGWLMWVEKYRLRTSILATFFTIGGVYGIFALWLKVLFPVGILFEGILR